MPRSGLDAIWRVRNGPGRAPAAVLQRSESYRADLTHRALRPISRIG
jgi:hypothetical protein